jgi:predicted ATPase
VALALGIREQAARPLIDTVCDALARERVILIFDNCEHVLTACSNFVERFVRSCASASVLATSREPLRVDGETTWRVPSLQVPESHGATTPSDLSLYSACRLFLDRARGVLPTLSITHQNAQAISNICRRLDGVPLAIELAAARVRMFTVPQVDGHLNRAFDFLNSGSRSAPPRNRL